MIHRKFNNLKFKRTYIGGSKQRELEIFSEIQGDKEDNSECNWFEYRRLLMQYCDDVLNIVLSWKLVSNYLRYGLLIIATLVSFINPMYSIPFLVLGFIAQVMFLVLKKKESKKLTQYNFSLDIINQQTGMNFSKN